MTTYTISQVKDMVGMPVPRIEAKVIKVFDRKTGEGQYGHWSIQNGEIEDSTGNMRIVFKQLPSQEGLVGRTMIFKSMEGAHGLKGVEVKKSDYKGKITIELHVSKVALIVGNGSEDHTTQVEPSTRMPQIQPQKPQEATISHEDRKLGIATAKNRMTQLAGLYDLCWKTVEGMDCYQHFVAFGGVADKEKVKDISTTLFIQSVREGLADKMPIRTTSKFYNEEAIKPGFRGEPIDDEPQEPSTASLMVKDSIPF